MWFFKWIWLLCDNLIVSMDFFFICFFCEWFLLLAIVDSISLNRLFLDFFSSLFSVKAATLLIDWLIDLLKQKNVIWRNWRSWFLTVSCFNVYFDVCRLIDWVVLRFVDFGKLWINLWIQCLSFRLREYTSVMVILDWLNACSNLDLVLNDILTGAVHPGVGK